MDEKSILLSLGRAQGLLWVAQQLSPSPLLAGVAELLREAAQALKAQAMGEAATEEEKEGGDVH